MQIFADPQTDFKFRQKGYVVCPFLNEDEVQAAMSLFESSIPELPADFYASSYNQNLTLKVYIDNAICAIVKDKLKRLFPFYKMCGSAFVAKRARSQKGRVYLHRDYTFVDPSRDISLHVWFPLIDVDERNGCIFVVPGSHTFIEHITAVPTNPKPWEPVANLLESEFLLRLPMRAGSALVYDERLLHGSDENTTQFHRPAAACILIPENVMPRLYMWNSESPKNLRILEVADEFLIGYQPGTYISEPYPEGVRYVGSMDCETQPLSPADLLELRKLQLTFQP